MQCVFMHAHDMRQVCPAMHVAMATRTPRAQILTATREQTLLTRAHVKLV